MDNDPYHSVLAERPPTSSSKKSQLNDWLQNKNILFDPKLTKKQLWDMIKPRLGSDEKKYVIDTLLNKHGHDVLRLPPYQCQYNPIEMAWGVTKSYYNKHRKAMPSTKNISDLWREALNHFDTTMWKNSISHCEKLIKADWLTMMGNSDIRDIPPIIISLAESDSDMESDFQFSSDSETD
jgi:transposase